MRAELKYTMDEEIKERLDDLKIRLRQLEINLLPKVTPSKEDIIAIEEGREELKLI